jgi:hypothetical protein
MMWGRINEHGNPVVIFLHVHYGERPDVCSTIRRSIPPLHQTGSQIWMCYYVGQADDLEMRLQEHLAGIEPDPCMQQKIAASAFRFAEIEAKRDRNGVERFLYDRYRPECN